MRKPEPSDKEQRHLERKAARRVTRELWRGTREDIETLQKKYERRELKKWRESQ